MDRIMHGVESELRSRPGEGPDYAEAGKVGTAPRKIAVISSYSPSLTNFRYELLKRMVEAGHSVTAFGPEDDAAVRGDLAKIGVAFVVIPMARAGLNPLQDIATVSALLKHFRKLRPDVVVPYTMKPIIYAGIAGRLAKIPSRCFLITGLGHVFSDSCGATLKGKFMRAASVLLYRIALSGAKVIFTYNEADDKDVKHYRMTTDDTKICRVPGSGIDLVHFGYQPPPSGRCVFLLIARLLTDKGIHDYVDAARLVKRTVPDAEFRLLGQFDPNPAAISRKQIQDWSSEGVIKYLGETRDVRPYLADCNVFVLPSYYREGIPRSILEALSTGRAVITTDLPGCRETVIQNVNGLLVPPRNAKALADAMLSFVRDPTAAAQMGLESRRVAQQKFDVHDVNKTLLLRMGLV